MIQGETHRGRVGLPTSQMSLNPQGGFAFGIESWEWEALEPIGDFLE